MQIIGNPDNQCKDNRNSTVHVLNYCSFNCGFQRASEMTDSSVEVQPLWEYPGVCLSKSKELLTFNLRSSLPQTALEAQGSIPITM